MAISGGHLNPAVTIGLLCAKKIDGPNAIGYIVSQCLAAVAASALLLTVYSNQQIAGGTPAMPAAVSPATGIIVEAVLTFFLVFVIYGTAVDKRAPQVAGIFIGLTVTLGILGSDLIKFTL